MVKYWLLDGAVLASGWVNSGPEKMGTVLENNKTNGWLYRQNCRLLNVLNFWWNPSLIHIKLRCHSNPFKNLPKN
jgi:hypothetical protein